VTKAKSETNVEFGNFCCLRIKRREFEDRVKIDFLLDNGFVVASREAVFPRVGGFDIIIKAPAITQQAIKPKTSNAPKVQKGL
jgi:hypothetical protein